MIFSIINSEKKPVNKEEHPNLKRKPTKKESKAYEINQSKIESLMKDKNFKQMVRELNQVIAINT